MAPEGTFHRPIRLTTSGVACVFFGLANKSKVIVTQMVQELVAMAEQKEQKEQKEDVPNVVARNPDLADIVVGVPKLQLWGAGVPINVYNGDDNSNNGGNGGKDNNGGSGSNFVYDHEHRIGIVGDWLGPNHACLESAWSSGHEFAKYFASKDSAHTSIGLKGKFVPSAGGSGLVGGSGHGGGGNRNGSGGSGGSGQSKSASDSRKSGKSSTTSTTTTTTTTTVEPLASPHVLVVGAGLVGALTIDEIKKRHPAATITCLEGARGAGGRCSTTRFGSPGKARR